MDLDSSLDDIIKKRSHSSSSNSNNNNFRAGGTSTTAKYTREPHNQQRHQSTSFRRNAPAHTEHHDTPRRFNSTFNPSRVNKPTSHSYRASPNRPSSSILHRIGPVRGGGSASRPIVSSVGGTLSHRLGSQSKKPEVDPSQIVITKSVKNEESVVTKPLPLSPIKQENQQQQRQSYRMSASSLSLAPPSSAQKPSLSIRGLSGVSSGLSIRGEGSPARVLISNLDPGANAEDVKAACSAFGTVLHCEVFSDPSGRSYGEAEVEFSTKQAALDCIQKLDNEIADGRVIRAILRNAPRVQHPPPLAPQHHPPPMHNFATQTLRSVIAPTRAGYTTTTPPPPTSTGKLYSDQLLAPEQQLGYPDYPPPPPPQSRWYS